MNFDGISHWRVDAWEDDFYVGLSHWQAIPVSPDGSDGPVAFSGSVGGDDQAGIAAGIAKLTAKGLVAKVE